MPIYEYKCNECDNLFEILTTSSNRREDSVRCSRCKSDNTTKLMSAGSFKLGTGGVLPSAAPSGCAHKSGFS